MMKAASSAAALLRARPARAVGLAADAAHICSDGFLSRRRRTARHPRSRIAPPAHTAGSVAKSIWGKNGLHNGTIEATSREGCRLIKAVSPQTKCFIYHNMELALESMESQRAVMYDASKADYFLQYTDGQGNRNGTIYNERQVPGDQYFWNFSNPEGQYS